MMERKPKYKFWRAIHDGGKVPRKIKKHFLGDRMSACRLNRLLKTVKIVLAKDENRPSYPIVTFEPYAFCPNCGCDQYRGVYRPGYYPEVWNTYYCLRCNNTVAYEDNSPFIHVLEERLYEQYEKRMQSPELLPVYKNEYFEVTDLLKDIL